jgi:hypothetical protein
MKANLPAGRIGGDTTAQLHYYGGMFSLVLSAIIRLAAFAAVILPPTRSVSEVQQEAIERLLDAGWTVCGDVEFMAAVERVLKRRAQRNRSVPVSRQRQIRKGIADSIEMDFSGEQQ